MTDGARLLLGHATGSSRWDIPKGMADPGEDWRVAAMRELKEETGLAVISTELVELGLLRYRPGKDLALFIWPVHRLPDPGELRCVSTFTTRYCAMLPEFDRFALVSWEEAPARVGKDMRRVLEQVRAGLGADPRLRLD
ncbi:MAG: NUDIX hydrolase [Acetobacteraceae bacterium]|nr:NUDIX hydrolase [Acetobacteraceae bacterium]